MSNRGDGKKKKQKKKNLNLPYPEFLTSITTQRHLGSYMEPPPRKKKKKKKKKKKTCVLTLQKVHRITHLCINTPRPLHECIPTSLVNLQLHTYIYVTLCI